MLSSRPVKYFAVTLIALSVGVSSTVANAAPLAAATPVSPIVALSAFGSPVSASAVRAVNHVPTSADLQMAVVAASAQGGYDNRDGVSDLVPLLIILGGFVGVMIFVLSGDNDGHIRIGQSISPD